MRLRNGCLEPLEEGGAQITEHHCPMRGLRVDGDVPAEQPAADDVAGVPGRFLRAVHVSPLS